MTGINSQGLPTEHGRSPSEQDKPKDLVREQTAYTSEELQRLNEQRRQIKVKKLLFTLLGKSQRRREVTETLEKVRSQYTGDQMVEEALKALSAMKTDTDKPRDTGFNKAEKTPEPTANEALNRLAEQLKKKRSETLKESASATISEIKADTKARSSVDALALLPRAELERRLSQSNAKLEVQRRKQGNLKELLAEQVRSGGIDTELLADKLSSDSELQAELAYETETRMLTSAIEKRNAKNYLTATTFVSTTIEVDEDRFGTDQNYRKTLQEIEKLRKEITTEAGNYEGDLTDLVSSDVYQSKLERLRMLIDQGAKVEQGDVTTASTREVYTGAGAEKKLREALDALPRSRLQIIRQQAGSGDSAALQAYIELFKSREGAHSTERRSLEKAIEKHDTDSYKTDLKSLIEKLDAGTLTAEDQMEFFVLSNSLALRIDADIAMTSPQAKLLSGIDIASKDERSLELAKKLGIDVNEAGQIDEVQIREVLEKITADYSAAVEKNNNPEHKQEFNEYMSTAAEYMRLDYEHIRDFASVETAVAQARHDLSQAALHNFFKTEAERDQTADITGTSDPFADELLSIKEIRQRFSQYGLIGLDLDRSDDSELFKQRFATDAREKASADEIAQISEHMLAGNYSAMYRWVNEGKNSGDYERRKELVFIAEKTALLPLVNLDSTDVSGNQFATIEPNTRELLEATIEFSKRAKEVSAMFSSEEQRVATKNYVLKTALYNNLLARTASAASLKALFEKYPSIDESFWEELSIAVSDSSDESIRKAVEELQSNFRAKDIAKYFEIELLPAGIGVSMRNDMELSELFGLPKSEDGVQLLAQGLNLNPENMLRLSDGKDFPGGIVAYTQQSRSEEVAHQLDRHLLRMLGNKENSDESYERLGLAELAAKLSDEDSDIFRPEYKDAKLLDLNILPELDLTKSPAEVQSQLVERGKAKHHQQSYLAYKLAQGINSRLASASESDDTAKLEQMAYRQILAEKMRRYQNDPDGLIFELARTLSELSDGEAIERSSNVEGKLREYFGNENIKNVSKEDFVTKYDELVNEFSTGRDIFLNRDFTQNPLTELETRQLSQLTRLHSIYQFAMKYVGSGADDKPQGASTPAPRNFLDVFENYRRDTEAKKWSELDTNPNTKKLTTERAKFRSYYSPNSHTLRYLPIDKIPVLGRIPMLGGAVNSLVGFGLKKVAPFNLRDFSSGFAGTTLGNYLNVSGYRASKLQARVEFFPALYGLMAEGPWGAIKGTFLGGKIYGQNYADKWGGETAKYAYEGHVFPDFIRNQKVDERNIEAFRATQEIIGGLLSGSEMYSLLESTPTMNLIVPPGDRPTFDQKIADKKIDMISDFDFDRMAATVFNPKADAETRMALSSGSNFQIGDVSYEVNVDPTTGRMTMVGYDKDKNIVHKESPVSEKALMDKLGRTTMLEKGKAFYEKWRPQEVKYEGERYFVHYDPKTGLSGLYKDEYIDWSKKPAPTPLKGKDDKYVITATYADNFRKVGEDRRKAEMDIAVNGLFQKIVDLRQSQNSLPESERYSLRDLVRSMRRYEDPAENDDSPFIKDNINGRRQIFIPGKDPNTAGTQVDYEVALELMSRLNRFYFRDRITRKAFVKRLNPENIMQDEFIPQNRRVRETVTNYLRLATDKDINPKPGELDKDRVMKEYKRLNEIKNPEKEEKAQMAYYKRIIDKYTYLQDYEQILYEDDGSLFKQSTTKNRRGEIRNEVRKKFVEYLANEPAVDIEIDDTTSKSMKFLEWEKYVEDEVQAGLSDGDAERIKKAYRTLDKVYEKYVVDVYDMPKRGGTSKFNIVGAVVSEMLDDSLAGDELYMNDKKTHITTSSLAPGGILTENGTGMKLSGMRSADYDKRTVTVFMERFSDEEVERTAKNVTDNVLDQLTKRQEYKQFMLGVMERAEFMNQEFMRYRISKNFWESLSRWHRRMATLAAFGGIIGMAATGNPAFFFLLLGSVGYNKFVTPYFDKRTEISKNRRNTARENMRKLRSEVQRMFEAYEKGQDMNNQLRKDLSDMMTEYDITNEGVDDLTLGENFKPKGMFLLDNVFDALFGEKGAVPQALS